MRFVWHFWILEDSKIIVFDVLIKCLKKPISLTMKCILTSHNKVKILVLLKYKQQKMMWIKHPYVLYLAVVREECYVFYISWFLNFRKLLLGWNNGCCYVVVMERQGGRNTHSQLQGLLTNTICVAAMIYYVDKLWDHKVKHTSGTYVCDTLWIKSSLLMSLTLWFKLKCPGWLWWIQALGIIVKWYGLVVRGLHAVWWNIPHSWKMLCLQRGFIITMDDIKIIYVGKNECQYQIGVFIAACKQMLNVGNLIG